MVIQRSWKSSTPDGVLQNSSSEDSSGSWQLQSSSRGVSNTSTTSTMHNRSGIGRQVALNTLSAMHRRYNLPGVIQSGSRPSAEYRASANKSLDMLRQTIQTAVTKEIDQVIKKYLEKFFVPAVNNIRSNLGEESVGEDQVRAVCRAMLDGARCLYAAQPRAPVSRRATSPSELSDSESSNGADSRFGRPSSSPKRKESDTDSDIGMRRKRRIEGSACPSHKWDPARLNQNTLFIMGSVANKVLGLGQSRGRLYSKHSSLVRYPADSADKEWIANQNMTTPSGGKTYIMVLEDIEELVVSEGYRNSPSLRLNELSGFRAPPFMLRKIQAYFSRHSDMSEDYTSSTPTPTPPPIDAAVSKTDIKVENKEHHDGVVIKVESNDDHYNKEGVLVKLENRTDDSQMQYPMHSNETIKLEKADDVSTFKYDTSHINTNSPGTYTSIVSSGVSSMNDSNYWNRMSGNQQMNDSTVRVDLNTANEFIDADIEFLSSDFCTYVDSEADVKKSFDKISEGGGGELYIPGDNTILSAGTTSGTNIEHMNYSKSNQDPNAGRPGVVTSFVRNIDVSGMPSPNIVHTYVTATGTAPSVLKTSCVPTSQQMNSPPMFSVPNSTNQATFSQAVNTFPQTQVVTQLPASNSNIITIQSNVLQPSTRTVYSLANPPKALNSALPPGPTIIGFGTRPTVAGNIINTGNFINISAKNFSSGNILHNAIVSRNMINRGMNVARTELSRTNIVTGGNNNSAAVVKSPTPSPGVSGTLYSRTAVPITTKIDDDSSITTTKSMIDNTCNSSAMLKKVLTLGSAGVNKTFLTPPVQKVTPPRTSLPPSNTTTSSNLSASHATLTALLSSGSDTVGMGQDKTCNPFPSSHAEK